MISVIITTFKNPKRLKKAINTVKNQTYKNIEILVIDGANSKECHILSENEGCRFFGLKKDLPPPNGVQRSRNVGLSICFGEYIAFLDDDDEWVSTKLEFQMEDIKKGSDLVSCNSLVIGGGKSHIEEKKRNPKFKDFLKHFEISSTSSIVMKTQVLKDVGGWNETIRGMHEYDVALRVSKAGYKITNVQIPLTIKYQDFNVQIGSVYWKIAEMFQFFDIYRNDVIKELGWSGSLYNIIKMWTSISLYTLTPIFGDRIWELFTLIKRRATN